jgi:hypothetical protein
MDAGALQDHADQLVPAGFNRPVGWRLLARAARPGRRELARVENLRRERATTVQTAARKAVAD